jgi:hypothetical protein
VANPIPFPTIIESASSVLPEFNSTFNLFFILSMEATFVSNNNDMPYSLTLLQTLSAQGESMF